MTRPFSNSTRAEFPEALVGRVRVPRRVVFLELTMSTELSNAQAAGYGAELRQLDESVDSAVAADQTQPAQPLPGWRMTKPEPECRTNDKIAECSLKSAEISLWQQTGYGLPRFSMHLEIHVRFDDGTIADGVALLIPNLEETLSALRTMTAAGSAGKGEMAS